MPRRFEGQFEGFDHKELFFQTWAPERVRGVMLITHGLAEHGECYHELATALTADGIQTYAWDMRGHGRSEGKRGYVGRFSELTEDLARFYDVVVAKHPEDPLIIFGHSLGGLVTLRFLQTHEVKYRALALSSPALGLSMVVPKLKERLAEIANRFLPTLTMHNEISYEDLTRDPEKLDAFRRDTLRHDKISPGLFLGMNENYPLALANVDKLKMPTLMQVAGDDRLVSVEASRTLFEALKVKPKQLEIYPDSLHEIYNDLDRARVVADLKSFISPYLGAQK